MNVISLTNREEPFEVIRTGTHIVMFSKDEVTYVPTPSVLHW